MEALILFLIGLSSIAFAHLLALRRRFGVILVFLVIAAGLYALTRWYLGTTDSLDGLALPIFAMVAVMPFAVGLILGAISGSLHLRRKSRR